MELKFVDSAKFTDSGKKNNQFLFKWKPEFSKCCSRGLSLNCINLNINRLTTFLC